MATNLIEFLRELLFDDDLRQDFADDPSAVLADHGLSHLTAEDVHDALVLLRDESSQDGDFSRRYDTGDNTVVATPAPVHHHSESHAESGAEYLDRYITHNYVVDRDTVTDHSINQNIDNSDDRFGRDHDDFDRHGRHDDDGGHFSQDIDIDQTTASGDGAVAAGDDVTGIVTTGDDNQVGNGNLVGDDNVTGSNNNAVTGDDNTTNFGSGSASSTDVDGNVSVGSGGAFSGSGNATVNNTDNSTEDSFNDQSEHSVSDSFNQDYDDSTHTSYSEEDSHNTQTDSSTHTSNETRDSHNVEFDTV